MLLVVIPILAAPEWSATVVNAAFEFLTSRLGVVYVIAATAVLAFLLLLSLGRYGGTLMGPAGEAPRHGRYSWAAMLFCTGIGSSLIYWGAVEWAFYYERPPFGLEPRSEEAILWASSYGLFHWGPVGWSFYCLPAVAFCCSYHLLQRPVLRLSMACRAVLGDRADRWPGRVVDLLFIVGLLATAATGLAFGTSMVSASVTKLTGVPDGPGLQLAVIALATSLIAFSVYRGLDRGIKLLSVINASLALVFLAFVLAVGPTRFIVEMGVASVGNLLQNFPRMLTWTDPLGDGAFVESWTVFYWAWWLALGPFVGMFVAKISRGRSLREVIFGMLGWGSLGCALFFIVLGNYALDLELAGRHAVAEQAVTVSPTAAIAEIVSLLPAGALWLAFVAVIGLIFSATTYDSAAYTLAAGSTRFLQPAEDPRRLHRVYWALMLGLLPAVLLLLGGLKSVQTASIVASVPLLPVYLLLAVSILRMLRQTASPPSGKAAP